MKPWEVWTCQRAENIKKKSSKIPQNNYAATMVSAARRQIIGGGGGGAPLNKKRGRRQRPQNFGGGGAAGARLYPKCTPFGMKCSKSRRFLGHRPRPRWGAYDAPADPLVARGFLPSAIACFAPSALAIT